VQIFMPSRSRFQGWMLGMVVFIVGIIDLTALAVSIKVSQAYNNADREVLLLRDGSSSASSVKAVRASNRSGFDSANSQPVASSSPKTPDTVPSTDGSAIAIAGVFLLVLSGVMRHLTSHGSR
jgi:hypothetical protein